MREVGSEHFKLSESLDPATSPEYFLSVKKNLADPDVKEEGSVGCEIDAISKIKPDAKIILFGLAKSVEQESEGKNRLKK